MPKTLKRGIPRNLHGVNIYRNTYSASRKREIANIIKPIDDSKALADFIKLRETDLSDIGLSRVGNNTVDRFTYPERLNTTGNKNITFYDFYFNRNKFKEKAYVKRTIDFCKGENSVVKHPLKIWIRIFTLYFGSVNLFRPLIAAKIYELFRPSSVLDFTMGWGGRLIGAMATDVPNYLGIDSNVHLKRPYNDMMKLISPYSKTKASFIFENALDIDYSVIKYDMAFSSPPYYDTEIYGDNTAPIYSSHKQWDDQFYRPLFGRIFAGLAKKGTLCLNIPVEIYVNVCIPLLGEADAVLSFEKKARPNKYTEFIYVWRK
jgi:hypothetical protein